MSSDESGKEFSYLRNADSARLLLDGAEIGHPLKAFQHPGGSVERYSKREMMLSPVSRSRHVAGLSSTTSPSFCRCRIQRFCPSLLDRFALKHHGLFPDDLIAAPDCMVHGRRQRRASSSAAAHWVFRRCSIASALECRSIIDEAEVFWSQYETDGIFEKGKSVSRLQTTTAMCMYETSTHREWLVEDALPSRIQPFLMPFSVRWETCNRYTYTMLLSSSTMGVEKRPRTSQCTGWRRSGGLALNDADYSGGGTYFEWTDQAYG